MPNEQYKQHDNSTKTIGLIWTRDSCLNSGSGLIHILYVVFMDIISFPVSQQYVTIQYATEFPLMPLLSRLFHSCK